MWLKLLLLLVLSEMLIGVEVEIKSLGKVRGYTRKSLNEKSYYYFEGIPYAVPPVGLKRFAKPQPISSWNSTLEAKTKYKCLQFSAFDENDGKNPISGQEDCLYLNIYTRSAKQTSKLPVIFFIHGGDFQFGSGVEMGEQFLMDHDVVYVNFNYRLGVLGFLSTEDDVVPGNMGMWDQLVALEFVKKHISYFGGDSKRITLYGMSAGAVSVHFHYLAKQSSKLFQRGFSQSGCMFHTWALMKEPLMKTKVIAAHLKCLTHSSAIMVNCLREKPGHEIVKQLKLFQPWLYNPFAPFGPVVDKWAKNPLLPKHPYQLIKNGKVLNKPWMTSLVQTEGLDPGAYFYSKKLLQDLDTNWGKYAPHLLDFNFTVKVNWQKSTSEKIRQKYLGAKKISESTYDKVLKMLGDRLYVLDTIKAIKLQNAKTKAPIYFYNYLYRAADSTSNHWSKTKKNFGASHGDDTGMMLKTFVDVTSTSEDRKMVKLMTNLLVSYAKFGKSRLDVAWRPISKKSTKALKCLKIKNPKNISMGEYTIKTKSFWDSLPIMENEKIN